MTVRKPAVVAAKEAVTDAGIDVEKEDLNKVGVILGVGIGGIHTFEEEVAGYEKTKNDLGPKFNPFFIPKMIADIASGQISIMYGFHGPNFTTTSACASSSNAIADAFNYIRLGKANIIVTGGSAPCHLRSFSPSVALHPQPPDALPLIFPVSDPHLRVPDPEERCVPFLSTFSLL